MKITLEFRQGVPPTLGYSLAYLCIHADDSYSVSNWMNIGGWDWQPESPIVSFAILPDLPLLK